MSLPASAAAAGAGPGGAAPAGAAPAVLVRGLVKRYDGRAVVDRLDLEVRRGELFGLLGPNGAGKTTTVEILEGYRRADAGEVRVLGLDPARDGRELRARTGLMLQGGGVYPQARAREILALFARFYRDPRDPDELLDLVGLRDAARTRYRVLSGGQRQRLGLALALVGRPELLVLDEPTAGMDPAAKASTRPLIAGLREAGTTILMTTHELADIERLADRVAIIDRGRLVALGTPGELSSGGASSVSFQVGRDLAGAERGALAAAFATDGGPSSVVEVGRPGAYRLAGVAATPEAIARLATWAADRDLLLLAIRSDGGTLEERYLELTGERGVDA